MRLISVVAALLLSACVVVDAKAQFCGQAYTSYYAPAYTSYYAPAAYQTNYSGWYPGYWWDRAVARVWGSPSTYVASYPSTYSAAYRPAYYAGYGGYATSYAPASSYSSCTAGYAPCNTYTTSYAPACGTCQSGCSTCSSTPVVTQASYQTYQQPAGCSTYAASVPATAPPTYVQPPAAAPQPTPAPASTEPPPSLAPSGPQSSTSSKPADTAMPPSPDVQPAPGSDTEGFDPYHPDKVNKSDSSTYFEAPKLFNPKDRTAKHTGIAPVRTAIYEQPVTYRKTSTTTRGPITAAQAQQDAIGWSSASK